MKIQKLEIKFVLIFLIGVVSLLSFESIGFCQDIHEGIPPEVEKEFGLLGATVNENLMRRQAIIENMGYYNDNTEVEELYLKAMGVRGDLAKKFANAETDEERAAILREMGFSEEEIKEFLSLNSKYAKKQFLIEHGLSEEAAEWLLAKSEQEQVKILQGEVSASDEGGPEERGDVDIEVEIDEDGNVLVDGQETRITVDPTTDPDDIKVTQNEDGSYTLTIPQGDGEVDIKIKEDEVLEVNGVGVPNDAKIEVSQDSITIKDSSGDRQVTMTIGEDGKITVEANGKVIEVVEGSEINFKFGKVIIKKDKNEIRIDEDGELEFRNNGKSLPIEGIPEDAEISFDEEGNLIIKKEDARIVVDQDGNVKLFEGEQEITLPDDSKVSLNSDGTAKVKLGEIELTYDTSGKVSGLKVEGKEIAIPQDAEVTLGSNNVVIKVGNNELTYNKNGNIENLRVNNQEIDLSMSIVHSDDSKIEFDENGNVIVKISGKNDVILSEDGENVKITINGKSTTVPSGAEVSKFKIQNDGSVEVKYKKDDKEYLLTVNNDGTSTTEDVSPPEPPEKPDDGSDDEDSQDATGGNKRGRGCGINWQAVLSGNYGGINWQLGFGGTM